VLLDERSAEEAGAQQEQAEIGLVQPVDDARGQLLPKGQVVLPPFDIEVGEDAEGG